MYKATLLSALQKDPEHVVNEHDCTGLCLNRLGPVAKRYLVVPVYTASSLLVQSAYVSFMNEASFFQWTVLRVKTLRVVA